MPLSKAEDYCSKTGLRLTELRRQVLELVWGSHRPVGAYDLLEQLPQSGRRPRPLLSIVPWSFCWRII